MKISLKWIQEFVDVSDYWQKPEALAEVLTRAGLEVEEITSRARDYQFVVTGLILEKDKHPNADKLSLCRVTTGEGVVHQIVCGAQNHQQNDKVVVALPGAVLPGDFAIKKAVVRGVESGGMLCSLKELGLPGESEGIVILPNDAPIGKAFAEYQGLDDVHFELKVTPNRADCLSHYGLAREVACLLGRPLKKLEPSFKISDGSTQNEVQLQVLSEQCPRYVGRFVRGVKVKPSPGWLAKRLESLGMNSINNIVDVTNYVMLELGQPLHAFDANLIRGRKIRVERSIKGETFETLQGAKLELSGEELMIRDGEQSVALAGVVGGKNSGVQETTTDIFLEAAYFTPMSVRKSSRAFGITTDSAYRFSRGVDPEQTLKAMDRATELVLQVAGGEALGGHHDHYPHPIQKQWVNLKLSTVTERLGYPAEDLRFQDFMRRLGCEVKAEEVVSEVGVSVATSNLSGASGKDLLYQVLPPTFRFDLEVDMDLVEEYARLQGYENIPETLPEQKVIPASHDLSYLLTQKIAKCLRATGFSQAVNMAFAGETRQAQFLGNPQALRAAGLKLSDTPVRVLNPLNAEANCLRMVLAEGLYRNMVHNFHQGVEFGRLFETGSCFSLQQSPNQDQTSEAKQKEGASYLENHRLSLIAWGRSSNLWDKGQDYPLIFEVKAAVEKLLNQFSITAYSWQSSTDRGNVPDFIHRGQQASLVVEGKSLGFIGTLHPKYLEVDKIRVPVAIAELDLEQLFRGQPRLMKIQAFSRFPKVERDLALVMSQKLKVMDVMKEARKAAGNLCTGIEIFDVYQGDKLGEGLKSVAFRLCFQDLNATLQDSMVNDSVAKVLSALQAKYSIGVR